MDKVELIRITKWYVAENYESPSVSMKKEDYTKASFLKSAVEDLCMYILNWHGSLDTPKDVTLLLRSYITMMMKSYMKHKRVSYEMSGHYRAAMRVARDLYGVLYASSEVE